MIFAREVHTITDHDAVLDDAARIASMRAAIAAGDTYVAKEVVPKDLLVKIRAYLADIGRNSLPNYRSITEGCPNFHRMNRWDARAYVHGCFHQFVFFPWNDDLFDFFSLFRSVYHLKNLLSGIPRDRFLKRQPEHGCTARLAFQFYPRGLGGLNKHVDPVDHHQLTVPTMLLSQKGEDFRQGGAYIERENGERILLDDVTGWGDVVYFNAQLCHGVERIDPDVSPDWLSFQGRWMLLFAINKLAENARIADSTDLEAHRPAAR